MPFSEAPCAPAPKTGSGISMGLREKKSGKEVRFTLNEKAQEECFGQPIADCSFKVMIGSGEDDGYAQLRLDDNGDVIAKPSMRGSAFLTIGHWANLPNGSRPAAECIVKSVSDDQTVVTIKLPEWATPTGKGGKLDKRAP
ncbi:MAG: hypothetical protein AAGL89_12840 [Pseudomonadota bacterium]